MAQRDVLPDPNWDDFEPGGEELDYGDDPIDESDRNVDVQGHEEVIDSPSSSSPFAVEEPQEPSSSQGPSRQLRSDQLPRVGEADPEPAPRARNIGPFLPPGFALVGNNDDSAPEDPSDDPEDPDMAAANRYENIGPQLPSLENVGARPRAPAPAVLGLALPPNFNPAAPSSSRSIGPTLPDDEIRAHARSTNGFSSVPPPEPSGTRSAIGPALPPDLLPNGESGPEPDDVFGPAPPPPDDNHVNAPPDVPAGEDEDDMIGPLPPGPSGVDRDQAAEEYALRRLALEQQNNAANDGPRREEWMLQLPKKLTNYGLGARTFSKSTSGAVKDDSWTETPAQQQRRMNNGEAGPSTSNSSLENAAVKARDTEQEAISRQLNSARQESLLDSHQRKRKADVKNGSSGVPGGRRAFDREKDMEVRGLKGASTDEIKKRCGQLSNRFGNSDQQKFL